MTTRKRNEFLDIPSDDEASDRGYDSEAEETKGRANAKRRRMLNTHDRSGSEDEGDDSDAGAGSEDESDDGEHSDKERGDQYFEVSEPASKPGKKAKTPLDKNKPPKKNKTGVVYLSSLPPYLKPFSLKSMLEARGFGPITKVFLTPEVRPPSAPRRRSNKRKNYTEGWVEFASKKTAKICAETLNASIVGGRKGGWYHDDIWNMKFLKGYKWANLLEQLQIERSEREAKQRLEDMRARKEEKVFLQGVEKGKVLEGMQKKNEEKRRRKMAAADAAAAAAADSRAGAGNLHTGDVKVRRTSGKASAESVCTPIVLLTATMSRALLLRAPWLRQEVLSLPFLVGAVPRHVSPVHLTTRTWSSTPRLHSDPPTTTKEDIPESESTQSHVPWYLREEPPVSDAAVSSRDQIPDLPADSPAILADILEYTFKDLGLDDLKLIDLRGLETPPALGANVIMIIGTARSVKHLNVSADRMCRWLRSTWKLSPYADGLLGRNELKIKLRRKARRARLASRSGTTFDDKDDGITTGWICVNAGVVEESTVSEQKDERFEGFGKTVRGTRVVVQMFTEEKRTEVDLETLWQRTLDRAEREKQKYADTVTEASDDARLSEELPSEPSSDPVRRSAGSFPFQQTRRFHSSRCLTAMQSMQSGSASRTRAAGKELPSENLELMSEQQVMDELRGLCAAVSTETTHLLKKRLFLVFSHCIASGYEISDELGLEVFAKLLPGPTQAEHTTRDKNLAFRVLDYLSLRGTNVLSMKVLNILYNAAVYEARGNPEEALRKGRHVAKVLETFELPFDPQEARTFMTTCFQNGDYDGFWRMWRKLPLNNSPRTFGDYATLFKLHAELGDEVRAQECVSTWAPMLKREEPPIPLRGDLRQSLMDCLILADPEIARTAQENSSGDLARIWQECQDVQE
ncbi:hypothetical protein BDV59DRAFT_193798 [Aspergillus ambiguus]|uniref:uncharacterized protein n=1 Tax=Aspergillus ambiguus TaxID=176160 RepID=UPI003CCD7BE4